MKKEDIKKLAHRHCWKYRMSKDPHHSDTYKFNDNTLNIFANKLIEKFLEDTGQYATNDASREAAAEAVDRAVVSVVEDILDTHRKFYDSNRFLRNKGSRVFEQWLGGQLNILKG